MKPEKQMKIPPHKSKGRPRTFSREAALTRALEVFWRRGYEPATMAELCAAMDINPPSLYAAFGNKAQLFMEAVQHYEDVYWDATWKQMETSASVHEGMATFFKDAAKILTSQEVPCGCMVILAATNVSPEGRQVNEALRSLRQEGKDCIQTRLQRAVEHGQLPQDTPVDALAATLNTMLEGMSLQARDGVTRDELERIAATAMALLPAPRTGSRTRHADGNVTGAKSASSKSKSTT